MEVTMTDTTVRFPSVKKMDKDLKVALSNIGPEEARLLVDWYYQVQEFRKAATNQTRAAADQAEPMEHHSWLSEQFTTLENQIKLALDKYSQNQPIGAAVRKVIGIGPVIAAGLIAHIDITKAPTAGAIWRYAGMDPTSVWEKGKRRPWNAALKVLCYKIGESFVKTQNKDTDTYGHVYAARKKQEWERNLSGDLSGQATALLSAKNIGKSTIAYKWYSGAVSTSWAKAFIAGGKPFPPALPAEALDPNDTTRVPMLPPAHIHSRARRYAVKLFLSDYHYAAYRITLGKDAPVPYVLEHVPGHVHLWKAPWTEGL